MRNLFETNGAHQPMRLSGPPRLPGNRMPQTLHGLGQEGGVATMIVLGVAAAIITIRDAVRKNSIS